MPKKGVDMVGSWYMEENLNGIPDAIYDNVIKHIDEEDVDGNVLGDDWSAGFQLLEMPPFDIFTGFPSGFGAKLGDDDSGPLSALSEHEEKPKLKDALQGNGETTLDRNSFVGGVKDSSLFQTTSGSVSVLESGSSWSGDNSVHIGFRCFIPVKRARSKRLRPPTLNPRLTSVPFISCSEKRKGKRRNLSVLSSGDNNNESTLLSNGTRKCSHCEVTKTPQWREGPMGPKTLCNACGVRYRSGRLFPEYRPAASPTFVASVHSNSHKKVVEMRKKAAPHEGEAASDSNSLRHPDHQLENSNGYLSV